uniref:Velo1 splice variant 1 n=1 Tax=Xenopus laevis TaxID=8355 RepID=Q7T225_XENLA|nr:velo1 splice variant 1 [Xenopus laevis]
MNTTAPPPENGQYSTNQPRPYFYAQPTAQLPFQNPWYLGQLYNPYCIPGPGFRGGNPYFPYYSVALHEYPGYFVPQPQMNTRMSRRPHFNPHPPSPMFYHATRFRHYSSPGRRTETKETQTDPRQQECASKKQHSSDGKGCDGGNVVYLSSGISSTGNESNLENVEMSMSPATSTQERDFHKNACNSAQYRNMPPGSYAYEKEEEKLKRKPLGQLLKNTGLEEVLNPNSQNLHIICKIQPKSKSKISLQKRKELSSLLKENKLELIQKK